MKARVIAVVLSAAVLVPVSAAPASAARPVAACGPGFTKMSFEEILAEWPPPPGVDGAAQLSFYDRNGDESLCVLVLPEPAPGPINVVDNVAAA